MFFLLFSFIRYYCALPRNKDYIFIFLSNSLLYKHLNFSDISLILFIPHKVLEVSLLLLLTFYILYNFDVLYLLIFLTFLLIVQSIVLWCSLHLKICLFLFSVFSFLLFIKKLLYGKIFIYFITWSFTFASFCLAYTILYCKKFLFLNAVHLHLRLSVLLLF